MHSNYNFKLQKLQGVSHALYLGEHAVYFPLFLTFITFSNFSVGTTLWLYLLIQSYTESLMPTFPN